MGISTNTRHQIVLVDLLFVSLFSLILLLFLLLPLLLRLLLLLLLLMLMLVLAAGCCLCLVDIGFGKSQTEQACLPCVVRILFGWTMPPETVLSSEEHWFALFHLHSVLMFMPDGAPFQLCKDWLQCRIVHNVPGLTLAFCPTEKY